MLEDSELKHSNAIRRVLKVGREIITKYCVNTRGWCCKIAVDFRMSCNIGYNVDGWRGYEMLQIYCLISTAILIKWYFLYDSCKINYVGRFSTQ